MQSSDCQDGQEDAEATNTGQPPVHPSFASQSPPSPPPTPPTPTPIPVSASISRSHLFCQGFLMILKADYSSQCLTSRKQ